MPVAGRPAPAPQRRAALAAFALLCWAAGYIYFRHQAAETRTSSRTMLAAIADLKSRQIVKWREERLAPPT